MAVRITFRKTKRYMFTVQVAHDLGGVELAELLAGYGDVFGAYLPEVTDKNHLSAGMDMTKADVEKVVRQAVWRAGFDAYRPEGGFDPAGNYTDPQAHIIVTWACAQVRRLFPELVDSELDSLEENYRRAAEEYYERRSRYEAHDAGNGDSP